MTDKGILVLGASGLIGRYLYALIKHENKKVIGTCNKDLKEGVIYFDVINSSIEDLPLENIKYVVICAAIAKLDICKDNPEYSREVNVNALKRIILELSKRDITSVFLSSGAVFDGVVGGYKEDDMRNPTSIYGEQKVEVEDFIISNIKDYLILRLGKVFGIKKGEGVLFTDWLEKYKNDEEILCADDEGLSPIYAGDVAKGILRLIEKNARGIYHLNPQEHYSRFEMANNFFKFLNINNAKIIRCSIDDLGLLEKRIKNSYLDASKFIEETGFSFTPLEKCYELIKNTSSQ